MYHACLLCVHACVEFREQLVGMGSVLLCECLGLNSEPQPWSQTLLPVLCVLQRCIIPEHFHQMPANPEPAARLCALSLLVAFANHKSTYCLSTCAFKPDATMQQVVVCFCLPEHTDF